MSWVSGLDRRVGQPKHEMGGCRSPARGLAALETRSFLLSGAAAVRPVPWAPVMGNVCASRTGVRVPFLAARGRRSQDNGCPAMSSMGASHFMKLEAVICRLGGWLSRRPGVLSCPEWQLSIALGSGLGRRVCSPHLSLGPMSGASGKAIPRHVCPATSGVGARLATKCEAVVRRLGGWQSWGPRVLSHLERQQSVLNTHTPVLGDVCANHTGVRVGPRLAPVWRSHETVVRPLTASIRPYQAPWLRTWMTCVRATP